jgi:hypothetical protein
MAIGDAFPLDDIYAAHGNVEEHIDQVVLEEVHLVYIQDPAVCPGQKARVEAALSSLERVLNVKRAGKAVLGRVEGNLHKRSTYPGGRELLSRVVTSAAAVVHLRRLPGRAVVRAVGHDLDRGKHRAKRANRGRFPRALLPADENPADRRVDRIDQEGTFQLFLRNDSGKGKVVVHLSETVPAPTAGVNGGIENPVD